MRIEGHTGPGNYGDNLDVALRAGLFGEAIVGELHGKYQEHLLRGNVFIYGSAAAGVTLNVLGNNLPTIWNPSDSGKIFVPIKALLGYVSATHVAGHLCWGVLTTAGAALGTAAPFSVFTEIAAVNALIGSDRRNRVKFATTCTATAAPTYLRPFGVSNAAMAAATAVAPFPMVEDFDGTMGLMPGSALQLAANAAIAMVASVAIIGLEIPLPQIAK